MKLLKKTALATAIALTAIVPTIESAEAAPRSYFSYVDKYAKYPHIQIKFVQNMLRNYSRTLALFESFVTRYAKYSKYSFYQRIVDNRDWYALEVQKYTEKLAELEGPKEAVVTVVNTEVTKDVNYEETTSAPREVESSESVVEETIDDMVYVYAVLTKVYETEIVTKELTTTTTITYYSNNTSKRKSNTAETASETRYERETVTSRELVNQYAVVKEVAEEVVADGAMGTATLNVLTVEEYMARDDVNMLDTETFKNAVLTMNSRVNEDYITREGGLRLYATNLTAIGAPEAWARGWTGEGQKIAILDTGIDLDHAEFEGKIAGLGCFTAYCDEANEGKSYYEGMQDFNDHGTHVAGIAAGALNGQGSTGVAPDAELLVAKIGNKYGGVNLAGAGEALAWASNNGAVVANLSANYNVSREYSNALTKTGADTYKLIDNGTDVEKKLLGYGYGQYSYSSILKTDRDYTITSKFLANFKDTEMVLVAAAGNQKLPFSTFPAHYAVYTDETGELAFDGRVIVAGNWDLRLNKLASSSNAAGTVCYDTELGGNTCDSDYRIKDFYLMAPGQYVVSANKDGSYETKSGTSMAAPAISGAVAVIAQMWPHMKGKNIAKLLLKTGNKDLPGYDENIHGQGLLDLAEATSPQGSLGIPTGGRVDGTVDTSTSGAIAMGSTASISAFDEVMVVDDFDRDFYIDANSMVQTIDTRTMSYTEAHKDKLNTNAYAGYANTMMVPMDNMMFGFSEDMKSFNIAYDFDNGFAVGFNREDETFLGNTAQNSLMTVNGAMTAYVGYNTEFALNDTVKMFGGATVGFTKAEVGESMLTSMDTLVSNTANIGAEFATGKNSAFGLVAALPVAITSGSANFNVAKSVNTDGTINYENVSSSLSGEAREYNVGAYYNFNEAKAYGDVAVTAFAEERINYLGQSGERDTAAGIKFTMRF